MIDSTRRQKATRFYTSRTAIAFGVVALGSMAACFSVPDYDTETGGSGGSGTGGMGAGATGGTSSTGGTSAMGGSGTTATGGAGGTGGLGGSGGSGGGAECGVCVTANDCTSLTCDSTRLGICAFTTSDTMGECKDSYICDSAGSKPIVDIVADDAFTYRLENFNGDDLFLQRTAHATCASADGAGSGLPTAGLTAMNTNAKLAEDEDYVYIAWASSIAIAGQPPNKCYLAYYAKTPSNVALQPRAVVTGLDIDCPNPRDLRGLAVAKSAVPSVENYVYLASSSGGSSTINRLKVLAGSPHAEHLESWRLLGGTITDLVHKATAGAGALFAVGASNMCDGMRLAPVSGTGAVGADEAFDASASSNPCAFALAIPASQRHSTNVPVSPTAPQRKVLGSPLAPPTFAVSDPPIYRTDVGDGSATPAVAVKLTANELTVARLDLSQGDGISWVHRLQTESSVGEYDVAATAQKILVAAGADGGVGLNADPQVTLGTLSRPFMVGFDNDNVGKRSLLMTFPANMSAGRFGGLRVGPAGVLIFGNTAAASVNIGGKTATGSYAALHALGN